MGNIQIKKVTPAEIEQLQRISRQTFAETFSAENSAADMNKYLDESFSLEKLSKELNNPHSEFYFALLGDEVIGYLKTNTATAQTEQKNEHAFEIERIYVLKAYHGKAVGQVLYEHAIQIAKNRKAAYVWLGVWEENARAISFYKKNGFVPFDKHIFKLGDDEQTDIMMKLVL